MMCLVLLGGVWEEYSAKWGTHMSTIFTNKLMKAFEELYRFRTSY